MRLRKTIPYFVMSAFVLHPCLVFGADTVETWDVGATDVDMYLGFDGIGHEEDLRSMFGDMMLGYGIIDGFSVYLGTTLQGHESMGSGTSNIYLGMFGTPLDTDHFDLDLFFDVSLGGESFEEFQIGPALELNFDLAPERQSWGVYLRAGIPVYGRSISNPEHPESPRVEPTFHIATTLGTYYTIRQGHQVLLEFDTCFHPDTRDEDRSLDIGGLAFGYNVSICDSIELINQVYVDIPQQDETPSVGIMLGFIATLPSVQQENPIRTPDG